MKQKEYAFRIGIVTQHLKCTPVLSITELGFIKGQNHFGIGFILFNWQFLIYINSENNNE
jgi:hypothetical protein